MISVSSRFDEDRTNPKASDAGIAKTGAMTMDLSTSSISITTGTRNFEIKGYGSFTQRE